MTKNVFWMKKVKTQLQQNKIKHENTCQSRELKPGPFAPKLDVLPLHQ